jgi:hypothetical protein
MHKKNKIWSAILLISLIIIFATAATAVKVKVGVVIEMPGEKTYTKCLSVDEGTDAFQLLQKTGRDILWSQPGPSGHGICSINAIGCPKEECFCASEQSWYTYIQEPGRESWVDLLQSRYFDGGESCDEHYCAKQGDILGLIYAEDGTKPKDISFTQICAKNPDLKQYYSAIIEPENPQEGENITVRVTDRKTIEGIRKAEVSAYFKGDEIFSGTTDELGEAIFSADSRGIYTVKLNVKGYEMPQESIDITVGPKSETTTTEPETVTTTTIEETTTEETTTSTEPTTTTSTSTTSTTTTQETTTTTEQTTTTTEPEENKGPIGQVIGFPVEGTGLALILGILVIVAAAAYFGYNAYKGKKAENH